MRGARGGGLGVPLPPELAFANSQVPSTLCNPATHFSKPCDTGHISALSFLLPLGAPQEGMARPGCAARLHRRRQEAAATGSSGMRARGLAWRSRTCILPSCYLGESLRAPHLGNCPLEVGAWAPSRDFAHRGAFRVRPGR